MNHVVSQLMFWLTVFGFIVLFIGFLLTEKNLIAPGSLAASIWLTAVIGGTFGSDLTNYWLGSFAVEVLVLSFGVGALGAQHTYSLHCGPSAQGPKQAPPQLSIRLPVVVVAGMLLLPAAMMAVVVPIWFIGVYELAIEALLSASSQLTAMRYEGDNLPSYANALLAAVYALSILGGWMWNESRPYRSFNRLLATIGLSCALIYALLTTARATFLFSIILFLGGYLAARAFGDARRAVRFSHSAHIIVIGIVAIGMAFAAFTLGGLIRASEDDISFVLHRIDAYLSGISGLSHWINTSGHTEPTWGIYSLAGLADLTGVSPREIGITQEYFYLPSGNPSNLYTAARWLYQDFGIVGAQIVISAFGFLAGLAWVRLKRGDHTAAAIYGVIVSIIIASPVSSLFAYNTIVAALGVFVALIHLSYQSSTRVRES